MNAATTTPIPEPTAALVGERFERRLEELLHHGRFEASAQFVADERVNDASLRDIAEGRALGDVTTLRDPAITPELERKIAAARAQED